MDKLGAQDIVDWAADNGEIVRIAVTQEHHRYSIEDLATRKRIRNHGERCTVELVDRLAERDPPSQSILIYEDGDVTLLTLLKHDSYAVVTTAAFLDEMERQQLIQSADHILDQAIRKGRNRNILARNAIHADLLSRIGRRG